MADADGFAYPRLDDFSRSSRRGPTACSCLCGGPGSSSRLWRPKGIHAPKSTPLPKYDRRRSPRKFGSVRCGRSRKRIGNSRARTFACLICLLFEKGLSLGHRPSIEDSLERHANGCRGKRKQGSKRLALAVVRKMKKTSAKGNETLGVYKCKACHHWHVGNSRLNRTKAL